MKTIGTLFKSLFSNQAVIDLRKSKWYLTLIVFILTIFLPWIPTLSSGYTANAASFLSATKNYDIDKGIKATLESDYFKDGISIKKSADGKYCLSYQFDEKYVSSELADFDNEYNGSNTKALYKGIFEDSSVSSDDGVYSHLKNPTSYSKTFSNLRYDYYFDCIRSTTSNAIDTPASSSTSSGTSTIEYETGVNVFMENFYIPALSKKTENYGTFLNNFVTSVSLEMQLDGKANRYPHSYTIWGKDFILIAVYPLKSAKTSLQAALTYSGDINDGFVDADIVDGTSFYKYLSNSDEKNINDVYKVSFATYLHEAGRPAYIRSVWIQIGTLSAVTFGCIMVASLLLLWFHKKKSSIYRDVNYFNCIQEAVYFTLTPSLLGMIFGFFNSQMVMVIIIGSILMRVVYSMSRICPPTMDNGQGGSKPLYQARS